MAVVFGYSEATNTVTVTGGTAGAPADFAQRVIKDRTTAASLLAAWAPNSNTKALTYQVRPVELLALLITFTVAGKTTETDYLVITGTDWLNVAQTEAIDVSAGIGVYVTTKYFRTITNVDCSDNAAGGGMVWADGTVAVTQPIWGVIWDKGRGQFQDDAYFVAGDGSTPTYFLTKGEQITIHESISAWLTCNNSTFVSGEVVDATDKTTKNGSTFVFRRTSGGTSQFSAYAGGLIYLYSTNLVGNFSSVTTAQILNAIARAWNCLLTKDVTLQTTANVATDIYNINVQSSAFCGYKLATATITVSNLRITDCAYSLYLQVGGAPIFRDCVFRNASDAHIRVYRITANKYLIDCDLDAWTFSDVDGNHTALIVRQNSFNLHVKNAGVNFAGAAVTLKDKNGSTVFSAVTGADGKIAEQIVTRGTYNPMAAFAFTDYSPHSLTISGAGVQNYVDSITFDEKKDLEVGMKYIEQPPGPLEYVND